VVSKVTNMKELLVSYTSYNCWANQELTKIILNLPIEEQEAEVKSSFPSLKATIIHMWDAETAWWQRLKLQENLVLPSLTFHPTTEEAIHGLLQQNRSWVDWVQQASVLQLEHVFAYQNSKKEQFKQPVWQMLLHVYNHGMFHRGQLVTILRQLGKEKIPQTDYIHYCRVKK
jgi:uncharacterized damage-inducible protein DinB